MSIEEAKQKIAELVAKYESLSPSEVKSFHEAKTKQGFIEPLFRALGWNFDDTSEVAPEEKASNGRVDYAFKLNGVSQFFLEAKPLKADLTSPDYVKQAVSYAYHKGVTWAVLTDFEEMRLFNAQQNKPFITLNCSEYLGKIDKLWLLSRESLKTGLLNKEAAEYGALPPALPIEKRLFTKLRQWREDLFNQLPAYNDKLSYSQIDEVIQRLFDRLIFIRTCEDRNIEGKRLLAAANQWKSPGYKGELIDELKSIFNEYNDIYDSELFDKHLTDQVYLLATTIEGILTGLYEIPGSLASYNFNDIDADVLGAVYEQYLGYVATKVKERVEAQLKLGITDEETFEIISKKQRRKEQGIYYTPKFVTDYIGKETVGRFIKEHDYNEIRTVKILDPACGSGSFLIRAYDELLNYHAKRRNRPLNELDQKDRLPVLLTNIYGVDLDMQAVEITRLNLLLRTLTEKGKLPYLSNNIREGNSLISGREEELKGYFGDNWEQKKPFNWERKFPDIMKDGGFDVVIGNPPYALLQPQNVPQMELKFIHANYASAQYKVDTYHLFLERGISLLTQGGVLGFIVPNTFLMNIYTTKLRELIVDTCKILEIIIIPRQVFPEAEVDSAILILQKESDATKRAKNKIRHKTVTEDKQISTISDSSQSTRTIGQQAYQNHPNFLFNVSLDSTLHTILARADKSSLTLGELAQVHFGLQTRDRRKYPSDVIVKNDISSVVAPYHPCLTGKDIQRYSISFGNRFVYFDETIRAGGCWDKEMHWADEKIIIRQIGKYPIAAFDNKKYCCLNTVFMVKSETSYLDLRYMLGIINSRFIQAYWKGRFSDQKMLFPKIKGTHLKQLPIRRIGFDNPKDKKTHDDLVALVEKMLGLNKRLAPIRDTYGYERDELLREIKHTDAEIDQIVYKLYGLTEKEQQVIEASLARTVV